MATTTDNDGEKITTELRKIESRRTMEEMKQPAQRPKSWSKEEEDILRSWYEKESSQELSRRLNRSPKAIKEHARRVLQLSKLKNPRWTEAEDKILRTWYGRVPWREVASRLSAGSGATRTHVAINQRARVLGVAKSQLWTEREMEMIRKYYSSRGGPFIAKLTGRALACVHEKARRMGIPSQRNASWNAWEDLYLQRLWPKESNRDIARKLGKKPNAVKYRIEILGLVRKSRPWSKEEIEFLRKNRKKMTHERIAHALGRTKVGVSNKLRKLGLVRMDQHRWSNKDRFLLKRLYRTHTVRQIAKRMGLRFTQVEGYIQLMGLKKGRSKKDR